MNVDNLVLEILCDIRPESDFGNSQNFLEERLLDSMDITSLIAALEEAFDIVIKGSEIRAENFGNLGAITALVASHGVPL